MWLAGIIAASQSEAKFDNSYELTLILKSNLVTSLDLWSRIPQQINYLPFYHFTLLSGSTLYTFKLRYFVLGDCSW